MFCTYIGQVKSAVGVEDDREDGEGKFQHGKLEGSQFEQEESSSGVGEEGGGKVTAVFQKYGLLPQEVVDTWKMMHVYMFRSTCNIPSISQPTQEIFFAHDFGSLRLAREVS